MRLIIFAWGIISLVLFLYLIRMRMEIRSINRQLENRWKKESKQLITLSYQNKGLVQLISNVNQCLKREEKALQKQRQKEKEFKQLIANVSHDLRTPLTAISGYLQLVEKDQTSENKNLNVAIKYSKELGGLVEHFFEYSYLVDAKIEYETEKINLSNLVVNVLADSVHLFEERNMEIFFKETMNCYVIANHEVVVRIIQNLIRNCLTHSKGMVSVWVEENEMGEIHFKNPIKENQVLDVERLFERFYTGDFARRKTTGLGLAIVKLLTENMNGHVYAKVVEQQLEIVVCLPVARGDE